MKQLLILLGVMICYAPVNAQCIPCLTDSISPNCMITVNSTVYNPVYNLGVGEKLCVTSTGAIYGSLNIVGGPATIVNEGLIEVDSLNWASGTIINHGTIRSDNSVSLESAGIHNYGIMDIRGDLTLNVPTSVLCNRDSIFVAADVTCNGNLNINGFLSIGNTLVHGILGKICLVDSATIACTDLEILGEVDGTLSDCAGFEVQDNCLVGLTANLLGKVDICDKSDFGNIFPPLDALSIIPPTGLTYCDCLNGPLAVEGLEMTARIEDDNAVIDWQMKRSTDIYQFDLEMWNSSNQSWDWQGSWDYSRADPFAAYRTEIPLESAGEHCFRLQAMHRDGSVETSDPSCLQYLPTAQDNMLVFPNPVQDQVCVAYIPEKDCDMQICLYDLQGKLIVKKEIKHLPAQVQHEEWIDLSTSSANSQTLILQVNAENRSQQELLYVNHISIR